jgi:Alpha galactosidase A/Alpha galactosidase C-terminal beta sandwich domain
MRAKPRARPLLALVAALAAVVAGTTIGAVAPGPKATAEDNGVGLTPAMGWSSWSFLRRDPTAAKVEAQARAMVKSGLAKVGYRYVNLDDFWYICPGSQGPAVDRFGRWVPNPRTFPPGPSGESGIQVVAEYVHSLGLKFGLYVTPGISSQAVAKDTPILGADGRPSGYTADEIADRSDHEYNYNCGGMVGINYKAAGAQEFLDTWADQFASWGIDYLKLDGVGSFDIADVVGWSRALKQTGRPIHLELSNSLNIHYASTWERYANGWRTGRDIECYSCESNGSSYPLTDYANVEARFNQVAAWRRYAEPGAFNDYDSIEVGNGSNDGLTLAERETQLSLWALASSPLILGTDLTHLNATDLTLLENTAVIAVDQDGLGASRVAKTSGSQIFAKKERSGDVIVGLFNTGASTEQISTSTAVLGLAASTGYHVEDLWLHRSFTTTGRVEADVASHGVALFRVSAG